MVAKPVKFLNAGWQEFLMLTDAAKRVGILIFSIILEQVEKIPTTC